MSPDAFYGQSKITPPRPDSGQSYVNNKVIDLLSPIDIERQWSELDIQDQERLKKMLSHADTIFFDLDDTIVVSKRRISPWMAQVISEMLSWNRKVVITTGWKFEVIMRNLVNELPEWTRLENLILFPLFWLEQYEYTENNKYELTRTIEEHEFPENTLDSIWSCLVESLLEDKSFLEWYMHIYGVAPTEKDIYEKILERRWRKWILNYSVSLLWQQVPDEHKAYKWLFDTGRSKRQQLISVISRKLKEKLWDYANNIVMTTGWSTSIDITWWNATKQTWIRDYREKNPEQKRCIFVWDSLQKWWNDHDVTARGMEAIWVKNPEETYGVLVSTFKN